eukprot:TRINITY_DN1644_c0_g1_i2.p1 TRINITY_DN1644_c0_g1~~TRINITY_DN1644_c0_g1_i2.p1  ORF type:complete len:122 (+),score=9.83 TRINITY_DN1644_c0_g1_i2:44-409(+)
MPSDEGEGELDLHMTATQIGLLMYGVFLAGLAIVDYIRSNVYELHVLLDAAGAFVFPVTVLYFFYPTIALGLAICTCFALVMYWVHHMMRKKSHANQTILLLVLTIFVALKSCEDFRRNWK